MGLALFTLLAAALATSSVLRLLRRRDLQINQEQERCRRMFELAPDIPQMLIGDPFRLTQILNNLVTNAIKFTESGEIFIKADVLKRTEETIEMPMVVRDSGMGISEENLQHLFTSFTQADSSITRKFGGTDER